ncbi:hypothetical protein A1O1_05328 [Capronia coronata CBS 617.96]|uniref:Uncharacterized protein n=1 Tax=Capronia coronata CBS 617.96 TaxID=1182541 RepID=W9Y7B7_9EURO|nr:uncharacterized protein A1O1_05328 [Capronia coronata CBS 617.96]EXJ88398.1 hypothetical protein A1O1_05328 [Capronia coronata CBS 617.96]
MERRVRIWTFGLLAGVFSTATSILNLIIAFNIINITVLLALRILLFVAFGISLLNLTNLAYFSIFYVKELNSHSLGLKSKTWGLFTGGTFAATVSIAVPGVALIWMVLRRHDLPQRILHTDPLTLIGVSLGTWAVSAIAQAVLYCLLWFWTKSVLRTRRASRMDLDFGIRIPSASMAKRPSTRRNASFGSQDPTVNSPPTTPLSRALSTPRRSSSTKIGQKSSRSKLIRHSNRSSYDDSPFPVGEAITTDSAFDNWDTSSVHYEMRAVIHSSPPVTRSGLETIPGSRPESPANALDGPFLPEANVSSSPQAPTSDSATMVGWSSSPRQLKSSPPSSPPNFSRPTSLSYNKTPPRPERFDPSMHELVHPLFRPTSPGPPPIPLGATAVTVSPLADHLNSPQTLSRLRSGSVPPQGRWRAMLSINRSETQSADDPIPDSPTLGSPGPSIVDDDELPPILPGFVLSAGSRTSLMVYGKRKGLGRNQSSPQASNWDPFDGHMI